MPNQEDAESAYEHEDDWRFVTGWYIPLKALNRVELLRDEYPEDEDGFTCGLRFHKNDKIRVDDYYIKRLADDEFDNGIVVGGDEEGGGLRAYQILIEVSRDRRVDESDAHESTAANPDARLPLTFRLHPRPFSKWQDIVKVSSMEEDPGPVNFDGRVPERTKTDLQRRYSTLSVPVTPGAQTPVRRVLDDVDEEEEMHLFRYMGDWSNHRYHGHGVLHDAEENLLYDGDWCNGQRWGEGQCNFRDADGKKWHYLGRWMQDEMVGGTLTLVDEQELHRLKHSSDPKDKWQLVQFDGEFELPRYVKRSASGVVQTEPLPVDSHLMLQLFPEEEADKVYHDSAGNEVPYVGVRNVDVRKAVMKQRQHTSPDLTIEKATENVEEALDEYMPHVRRWRQLVDPERGKVPLLKRLKGGVLTFADGSLYKGPHAAARPHSGDEAMRGVLEGPTVYCESTWTDGRPSGRETLLEVWEEGQRANAVRYVGDMVDGLRDGAGELSIGRSITAKGTYRSDVIVKDNVEISYNDPKAIIDRYSGPLNEEGQMTGEGLLTMKNGCQYKGGFVESTRHGWGEFVDANGDVLYLGEWKRDVPDGRCSRYVMPDGVFAGEVHQGRRQGEGTLYDNESNIVYVGCWLNDLPHGPGKYNGPDGSYDGEFKAGRRSGKGKFTYKDEKSKEGEQRYYSGQWHADKPHGDGTYRNEKGKVFHLEFDSGNITEASKRKNRGVGALPNFKTKGKTETHKFAPSPDIDWINLTPNFQVRPKISPWMRHEEAVLPLSGRPTPETGGGEYLDDIHI
eukprot:GHVU01169708.1.p1 GENE.GHVU01169708.1~~GHVU01169708.1.p1  ORF type:complete len:812 (-),score=182.18 GHVU01169708.1:1220-3592(-)